MELYSWIPVEPKKLKFLGLPDFLYEQSKMSVFEGGASFDRTAADGLICVLMEHRGMTFAVAATDFRVRGGSLGKETGQKLCAFLDALTPMSDVPLLMAFNSMGARFWEGRTVFGPIFAVLPALFRFSDKHPLYAAAIGRTIGISAPLFAIGHLRIAQAEGAQLSLTGPSVMTNFFGVEIDFDVLSSPQRQQQESALVHEISPDRATTFERVLDLVLFRRGIGVGRSPAELGTEFPSRKSRESATRLLASFGDEMIELFPGLSPVVRTYLVRKGRHYYGLFLNPPYVANNTITADTLIRYDEALAFFRAERLPILSCLDTPGIDPRCERSGVSITRMMRNVARKIIDHPYPRMGVISGRCYGGAASLGFPKCFGNSYNLALRGANVGVMAPDSISHVLKNSKQMLLEWQDAFATQDTGLQDLVRAGLLDAVIEPEALSTHVQRWLEGVRAGASALDAGKHADKERLQLLTGTRG